MGILNRKKNKRTLGIGLADHGRSPRNSNEQEAPEPERTTRLDEEADTAVHEMNDPPKAEGER